jgi:hypothetical protein
MLNFTIECRYLFTMCMAAQEIARQTTEYPQIKAHIFSNGTDHNSNDGRQFNIHPFDRLAKMTGCAIWALAMPRPSGPALS